MKDVDKQVDRLVKEWYTSNASIEWRRLHQDPYHQIEFMVTMRFLEKYLPKCSTVLDAGGGPDRYSIELAKRGYNIVLLDLVPEMLEIARRKMRRAGVLRIRQFVQGARAKYCLTPARTRQSWEMLNTSSSSARKQVRPPRCRV
jgi:ubiquinone/menaquinone biosynthesis C-methylase UbiE